MKVCVLSLILVAHHTFAFQSSAPRMTISDTRNLWRATTAPFQTECIYSTKVKQEVVEEFFNYGKFSDNPFFKCFLYCTGSKVQVFDAAGVVDPVKETTVFANIDLPLVQRCAHNIEPLADRCQKAYLLVKCIHDDLAERF